MRDKKINDMLKQFSIDAWLNSNTDYGLYYDDRYSKPDFKPMGLNCDDDRIELMRKQRNRVELAKRTPIKNNMFNDVIVDTMVKLNCAIADAYYEFVNQFVDEVISFEEAEKWVNRNIDFSNMKLEEKGGKYFIVIEPKIRELELDE